jgi:hypothetical protein
MLTHRTGWKLTYLPRDKAWEYQLEIPLYPQERQDDLIIKYADHTPRMPVDECHIIEVEDIEEMSIPEINIIDHEDDA